MRKFLSILFVGVLTVFFTFSSVWAAEENTLSLRDELMMKNTLHVLWDMDFRYSTGYIHPEALSQLTLVFMERANYHIENIYGNPERFTNMPEEYDMFFPKEEVEKVALNVFGGWINKNNLNEGIFIGAKGYYVNHEKAILSFPMDDGVNRPGFVEITSKHMEKDGSVILNGMLRRFQNLGYDGMIICSAATFLARFSPSDGDWKLESFVITEEAMG